MTPLLVDMNLSPLTVQRLRDQGWDVLRVSEVMTATTADTDILDWARQKGRVVVTQDLDVSTLVALSGHTFPSLITLRLSTSDLNDVASRLLAVLPEIQDALETGHALTVGDHAVRLRTLPIR